MTDFLSFAIKRMGPMPLGNHRSLCARNAKIIVSKDVGNREHRGLNPDQRCVTHYKIDGMIITKGSRCDFVLINESDNIVVPMSRTKKERRRV